MGYIRFKPFKQRDGWHYWGRDHGAPTPEIIGPFKTKEEAQKHADGNRCDWLLARSTRSEN